MAHNAPRARAWILRACAKPMKRLPNPPSHTPCARRQAKNAVIGGVQTLYNRFIRWSRMGVFDRIFAALASAGPKPERIMIDATHLKAHRTAASLLKKGRFPAAAGAPKAA